MIPIDDDVFPAQGSRKRPRLLAALAGIVAAVMLVAAIGGAVTWLRHEDSGPPTAVPEEPTIDRAEEVLGEVFSREGATTTSTSAATTTTSTTLRATTPSTTTSTSTTSTSTTSTSTTTTTTRPTDAPPPIDLTVSAEGEAYIEQYFSAETLERYDPNSDCGDLHEFYEVVVYDGDGNKLGAGELTGGTYERENDDEGGTTTRCTYDYRVTVPEAETYLFTLAEASNHDAVEDSEAVTAEELREGGAPTLSVNRRYCPEC